jgi:CRP-like cAMP-binding protein
MSEDHLFAEDQTDDLDVQKIRRRAARVGADDTGQRHIGCPLWWFKLVFPIVRGKNELAVALCLYRLRTIRHSRTVMISNMGLLSELGVDRYAKYRALHRLADAGIIRVRHLNKRSLKVVFLQKRGKGR